MLSQKKVLSIHELRAGMISSVDISLDGKVLLAKDTAITEPIINKLKETYIIDKVEVYLEDEAEKAASIKMKTVKEMEVTFTEFSSNLENIFDKISTLTFPQMVEIRNFTKKIQEEFNSTGVVIKNIVFYGSGKDSIYRHSVNVAAISFILGKWLGFDERELSLLTYSAILHDYGKLQIDKSILDSKNDLTPEEYDVFKTHPVIGYHVVKEIPYIDSSVSLAILMHHERGDGSGYPLGIKEEKIHKFAKIIAIADVFDEVCSNRYSHKIRGPFDALKIIQEESLTKLDTNYCNMFLNHIVNYYMGEKVLLNDERCCKIIQVQLNDLTNPLLLDDNGFLDLKNEKDLFVEKLIV